MFQQCTFVLPQLLLFPRGARLRHLLVRIRRIQQLSAQLSATVDNPRDIQRNAEHLLEEATILVESFYGEGVRRPTSLVRAQFGSDGNCLFDKPE